MPRTVKEQILGAFAPEVAGREEKLQRLIEQIQRYGKVVNLTGSLESDALWREFGEALLGYRAFVAMQFSEQVWIDIGSGGGLPGLVFAVLLEGRSDAKGVLIEPRKRRADFLRLTVAQLQIKGLDVAQATLNEDGSLSRQVSIREPTWVSARAVFSPEEWLERAGQAWPRAHCMVHGQAKASANRQRKMAQTWSDHCVEIWSPVVPAS